MTTPLDDVAFLTRSANRVAVMRTLADGPHSRQELVDKAGGSRVTIARILSDFEGREWVQARNGSYELTTQGRLVIAGLDDLLDRLAAIDRLEPVLPWFAVDQLDVPVEAFADADITVPTGTEPNRHHRRIGQVGATADVARMYSQAVTGEAIAIHRTAVDEGQELELLLTPAAAESALGDEDIGTDVRALGTDGFVGRVDESLPVPFVALFDECCHIGVADDRGFPVGVVESTDEAVVAWAERTLDRLAAAATPL